MLGLRNLMLPLMVASIVTAYYIPGRKTNAKLEYKFGTGVQDFQSDDYDIQTAKNLEVQENFQNGVPDDRLIEEVFTPELKQEPAIQTSAEEVQSDVKDEDQQNSDLDGAYNMESHNRDSSYNPDYSSVWKTAEVHEPVVVKEQTYSTEYHDVEPKKVYEDHYPKPNYVDRLKNWFARRYEDVKHAGRKVADAGRDAWKSTKNFFTKHDDYNHYEE